MASKSGDVVLSIGANAAAVDSTLKSIEGNLQAFAGRVSGLKSTLESVFAVAGIGLSAQALADLVKNGAEAAEQMGKMAQVAGLSVEEMSRLAHAAKMGDLSTDQLSKGILKLSEAMTKGAAGGREQAAIFSAMGFSARDLDGMLGDTHGALLKIADKIAGYADGAEKAALVSAIFGDRLARELLPFLNQGADGIRSLEDESDRLGKTLSADVVAGANEFNDALKRLSGSSQMFGAILANELAPSLTQFVDVMSTGGSKLETMREVAEVASTGFKLVATGALYAYTFATMVGKSIADVAASAERLAHLDFKGASAADEAYKKDLEAFLLRMSNMKEAIWNPEKANRDATGWAPDGDPQSHSEVKARAPLVDASGGAAKAEKFKLFWEEFKAAVDAAQKSIDTANKNWGDEFAAQVNAATKSIEEADKNWWSEFNAQVAETSTRLEEAGRVFEATRTPVEQYRLEIERLSKLQLDPETFARATEQATQRLAQSYEGYIAPTVNAALDGFAQMSQGAMSFGDVMRSVWSSILQTATNAMSRMLTEWIAMKIAMSALNASSAAIPASSSGLLAMTGSQLPPGRAIGGPVTGGAPYIVGERGPELFVPNSSGSIVPNGALGGGVNVAVHNYTPSNVSVERISRDEIRVMIREGVEQHAPSTIARDLYGPNSRTRTALARSTKTEARR